MTRTLTLNRRGWEAACTRAQIVGADAIAQHLGLNPSTYYRVIGGHLAPGPRFIAAALAAFPTSKFEDLFDIATKSVAA